jgi:hypothetical protein
MYCSSCGSAIPPNLSYCKICGTKLTVATADLPEVTANSFPDSVIAGMVATLVFGTGVVMGLMAVMSKVGFELGLIIGVSMLIFILMFVIEALLIYLALSARRDARKRQKLIEQTTREIEEGQARLLSEPMASVTENTTRGFKPVYVDRKSE